MVAVNADELFVSFAITAGLVYLGTAGQVLNTITLVTMPITTAGFNKLECSLGTIIASQRRLLLSRSAWGDIDNAPEKQEAARQSCRFRGFFDSYLTELSHFPPSLKAGRSSG